jgi:hypothetical protein
MIDNKTLALFRERYKAMTADGRGDDFSNSTRTLTLGLVVGTDDPLEQGRLQVFCPALNDNPKKIQHLPWCAYITPFGGSINNPNFTRGTGDGEATSIGAIHYGFWGVPDLGAHVLVGCIDGDPRRRFWVGCLPEHQETHTQFTGRYDWHGKKGTPDGPLTSSKKPIQPLYDNWTKAFVDRASAEWKTRGADYQPMAVSVESNGSPSKVRGEDYLDESYEGMSKHEKDKWVREVMGAHGYDWSGFKGVGAFKSSRVFGFSTPGFHSLSMDDRPFNSRAKLRTATGHMILLDDTNERIYIMTNKGNNWIEMDSNGNIDMYSERRVSINAAKDLNLTTGGTLRMHADGGIHMYAGHSTENHRGKLAVTPKRGEIRIQSEDDIHVLGRNLRHHSLENSYHQVGINRYEKVGQSSYLDVTTDINIRTLVGDYIKSVAQDNHETVMRNSKRLAYGTTAVSANGDAEFFSFNGDLSVGSQGDTSVKSANGDVNLEAKGQESGNGNVSVKTPKSQQQIGDKGVEVKTEKSIAHNAGENIDMAIKPGATLAGMFGASASSTLVSLSAAALNLQSMSQINFKSMASGFTNTHSDITQTLNNTVTGLNQLSYYTSILTTAVAAVADAADVSMPSIPLSIDVGSIVGDIFKGAIPSQLTSAYATLQDLESAVQNLGIPNITLPIKIENLVTELAGNTSALAALGLPTDLSFPINPSILGGIDILKQLNLNMQFIDVQNLLLPKFRDLVHNIFENVSSSTPPPSPKSPDPLPPIVGPIP